MCMSLVKNISTACHFQHQNIVLFYRVLKIFHFKADAKLFVLLMLIDEITYLT